MQLKSKMIAYVLTMVSVVGSLAGAARAETQIARDAANKAEAAVEKVLAACEPELKSFCSAVTPGDGRLALCLMAHEDKISDTCYDGLLDVADGVDLAISNVDRAAKACGPDIEKHCGKVEAGEGRIAQCLIDKKTVLSTACIAEVAGFEARMKK
ncbi:MAG: cysteine rich repeat-containing protein [Hyphomicrobium sp.]